MGHFTIIGFVKASEKFQDPEWDGEPVEVVKDPDVPKPAPVPGPDAPMPEPEGEKEQRPKKIVIKLADGKDAPSST